MSDVPDPSSSSSRVAAGGPDSSAAQNSSSTPKTFAPREAVDFATWELTLHSQRYLTSLAIAVAVFVPQLALMALLLTSTARVGAFIWVGLFLVISDVVTIWQSAIALKESSLAHSTESWLRTQRPGKGLGDLWEDPNRPVVLGFVDRVDILTRPTGNWSFGILLGALIAFLVGVSSYTSWLWFHP